MMNSGVTATLHGCFRRSKNGRAFELQRKLVALFTSQNKGFQPHTNIVPITFLVRLARFRRLGVGLGFALRGRVVGFFA